MLVVLTGGIGSGKSTVSRYFEELGVPVIDTDLIAREQVAPGMPALQEIINQFGKQVLDADGRLNRARLRRIVFDAPEKRRQLEQILHPRIRAEVARRLQRLDTPYAVVVVPLLLESGHNYSADRILVVDLPEALQIKRIRQRDALSEIQIRQILAAQTDRASRRAIADDLIENSGDLAALKAATEQLHEKYLRLSAR